MKKVRVIPWLGLFGPVLLLAASARADVAADLKQAEGLYQAGQYAQAEQIYLKVIEAANPAAAAEAEAVFKARRRLPAVYLAANQLSQAQAAVVQLLTDYGDHPRLPHALHEVLDQVQALKKTQQAGQIYQTLLTAQPNRPQALWLKMGIAIANVHLGDDKAVNTALGHIASGHAADERVAEAFGQVAWTYRQLEQFDKAIGIYQYVVDHWPAKERAIFSQRGLIWSHIAVGDEAKVRAATEKLLADFAEHKDLPEVVYTTANEFRSAQKYESAIGLYQYMVDHWPSHAQAIFAQRNTILSYLALDDDANAQAALQELVTQFGADTRLPGTVAHIGEDYRRKGRHANARSVHEYVVQQFPASKEAITSQRNAILCSIALNDEAQIEAGLETLLTQFARHDDIAPVVAYVAHRLGDVRDEAKVRLYQYLIDRHPMHELVVVAKARLGQILIRRGDDHGAEALFQKILADYQGHPRLAEAVHLMADGYLDQSIALEKADADRVGDAQYAKMVQEGKRSDVVKDYARRAIEKWQVTIRDLPPTPRYTEHAWYFTGVVYRRHLDEPEKAIPYYEKVVETWPQYQYAWSAQAMLAYSYETLARAGKMKKEEAEPKIEQAHQAVLEKYPDCSLAAPACLALADLHLRNRRWDQAAPYLQQFLERYPQAREWTNALILLGITYERRDKPEIAAELYRSYLANATPGDPRVKMIQAKLDEGKEVKK